MENAMYLTKGEAALHVIGGGLLEYNSKDNPPDSGWCKTCHEWPMHAYNHLLNAADRLNFRKAPTTEAKFKDGEFVRVVAKVESDYYTGGGTWRRHGNAFYDNDYGLFARVQRVWYADDMWKYDLEDGSGLVQTVYESDIRKV
jgi:hypothetical protein